MLKRGQIGVFAVIGLIILIIVALVYFLAIKPQNTETSLIKNPQQEEVKIYTESCLNQIAKESIIIISAQGGYYKTPLPFFEYNLYKIPLYFDQKPLKIPSKELMEEELNKVIKENINNCLKNYEDFKFPINKGNPEVTSTINPYQITFQLEMPLSFSIKGVNYNLKKFTNTQEVELGKSLETLPLIIEKQKEQPGRIMISYLSELGKEEKINFNIITLNETALYNLEFDNSKFNNNQYVYTFAMKYGW